jgi:hypothetical protein
MPDHNGVKKNRLKRHSKTSSSSKSNSFDSSNLTINTELFATSLTSNLTSTFSSITNNKQAAKRMLRVLIFTESFHPYTSGIARRFKEIIERLAKRGFLIHVVTGCRVNTFNSYLFAKMLAAISMYMSKLLFQRAVKHGLTIRTSKRT